MIGAVLLRYNGDSQALHAAVAAILHADNPSDPLVGDVLLVDNASTVDPSAVDRVAGAFHHLAADGRPLVRVLRRQRNDGFAAGNNDGIANLRPSCDMVLIHNDDATLAPGALGLLADALKAAPPEVISVGPKTFIAHEDGLLDSIGMAVNARGEAKNVGLGQLDLGQFDASTPEGATEIFGPCFAVALIRRDAFDADQVGPLPNEYFLYYEDVEWNWRAQRLGRRSLCVTHAHAFHAMSSSSRTTEGGLADAERAYQFKHRCIERNLLVTGAELLPARDAVALWLHRWPRLVKAGITGRFPKASVLAAGDALRRLPGTLLRRRHLSQRAVVAAAQPLSFWTQEPIYFDPVTYEPKRSWEALAAAARRTGNPALVEACQHQDPVAMITASRAALSAERAASVERYLAKMENTAR